MIDIEKYFFHVTYLRSFCYTHLNGLYRTPAFITSRTNVQQMECKTPLFHLPTMDLNNVKRDFRGTKEDVWKGL